MFQSTFESVSQSSCILFCETIWESLFSLFSLHDYGFQRNEIFEMIIIMMMKIIIIMIIITFLHITKKEPRVLETKSVKG